METVYYIDIENRLDTILSFLLSFCEQNQNHPEIVMIFHLISILFSILFPFFFKVSSVTNRTIISSYYVRCNIVNSFRKVFRTILSIYDDKLCMGRLTKTLSKRRYLYQHGDKINVVLIGSDLLRLCIITIHIT